MCPRKGKINNSYLTSSATVHIFAVEGTKQRGVFNIFSSSCSNIAKVVQGKLYNWMKRKCLLMKYNLQSESEICHKAYAGKSVFFFFKFELNISVDALQRYTFIIRKQCSWLLKFPASLKWRQQKHIYNKFSLRGRHNTSSAKFIPLICAA